MPVDTPPVRTPDFGDDAFRTALGRFPTGVTIITARAPDGAPVGLTVSSFNSVSLHPPLVLWSLALKSRALEIFETVDRYAIHVLAAGQARIARQFAMPGVPDRFADVAWQANEHGTPRLLEGQAAWFECYNRSRYREGDHLILIGEVERCGHSGEMPLVFHAGGFDLTPGTPTGSSNES
ncbi:MAG: flavin reductase family protein [Pigmentiphaga sp.]|nr:flavin reductase family protein [Pigmentiphaga sp.]